MAGFGALGADRSSSAGFVVGSAAVPVARGVLGADHDAGDNAVLAGRSAYGFVATFCGNRLGSGGWRHCGELLRARWVGIRGWHFPFRTAVRLCACGSKCI